MTKYFKCHKKVTGLQNVIMSYSWLYIFYGNRSSWQNLEGYVENLFITYRKINSHKKFDP